MISVVSKNGQHRLFYGSDSIPFAVEFRSHQRLSIHVYPDGRVEVIAPKGRKIEEIFQRVKKRAPWIAKQRAHFETFRPLPQKKRFVSGETHLYLGRQYRLKVRAEENESVKLKGQFLMVSVAEQTNIQRVESLLDNWYRTHAEKIFQARLDWCLNNALSLQLGSPRYSIRRMTRRWGSCTKAGNILLNLELVKTPLQCIEYVIMHELCHLLIHNHTPAYYRLLTRCMPDWSQRKARLDTIII